MNDWLGMAVRPEPPRPALKAAVLGRALAPRRGRRWGVAVAAAAVLMVSGAGWWAWDRIAALEATHAVLERRILAYRDTLALVHGPHTRSVTIPVTTGGRLGSVTIFEDTLAHRWLVRCENLAVNEPGRAYQLWFVTDAGVRHALTMPMDHDAPMVVLLDLPGGGERVVGVAMSVEPRQGSTEPTGPTVFRHML